MKAIGAHGPRLRIHVSESRSKPVRLRYFPATNSPTRTPRQSNSRTIVRLLIVVANGCAFALDGKRSAETRQPQLAWTLVREPANRRQPAAHHRGQCPSTVNARCGIFASLPKSRHRSSRGGDPTTEAI